MRGVLILTAFLLIREERKLAGLLKCAGRPVAQDNFRENFRV